MVINQALSLVTCTKIYIRLLYNDLVLNIFIYICRLFLRSLLYNDCTPGESSLKRHSNGSRKNGKPHKTEQPPPSRPAPSQDHRERNSDIPRTPGRDDVPMPPGCSEGVYCGDITVTVPVPHSSKSGTRSHESSKKSSSSKQSKGSSRHRSRDASRLSSSTHSKSHHSRVEPYAVTTAAPSPVMEQSLVSVTASTAQSTHSTSPVVCLEGHNNTMTFPYPVSNVMIWNGEPCCIQDVHGSTILTLSKHQGNVQVRRPPRLF